MDIAKQRLMGILFPGQQPGNRDSLSSIVSEHFGDDRAKAEHWIASTRIDWIQFLELAVQKSNQVFASLASKSEIPPDVGREIQVLALREACARQLQQLLGKPPRQQQQQEVASPFTLGARFNQIPSPVLSNFVHPKSPPPTLRPEQQEWLGREWAQLGVLDCERAERMRLLNEDGVLELSLAAHKHCLPALLSVCELLCCLPRELHFKLNRAFTEVSHLYLVKLGGDGGKPPQPLEGAIWAAWVVSRTPLANRLELVRHLAHVPGDGLLERWMVCVWFLEVS
ncbi:hypothetical protein BASA81_006874 [Batrachochytrium salamandrivorans]|nr:hypothetical protein BASA81_006874 [Batrachochytrium salamandrivorans]